jgi:ubiquinol oxidase
MRSPTPAQRRQWQEETPRSPGLRSGIPARLLFRLEDVVFPRGRSVPKFRALEVINRVAYQAWEQAAYYLAGELRDRSARARQLHDTVEQDRAEQDNENRHALILDELEAAAGRQESWLRFRLLPQLIAFGVYLQFWLMRASRPSWATGSTQRSKATPSTRSGTTGRSGPWPRLSTARTTHSRTSSVRSVTTKGCTTG